MWGITLGTTLGGGLIVLTTISAFQVALTDPQSIPLDYLDANSIIIHVQTALSNDGLSTNLTPRQVELLIEGIETIGMLGGSHTVNSESLSVLRNAANLAIDVNGLPTRAVGINLEELVNNLSGQASSFGVSNARPQIPLVVMQDMREHLNLVTDHIVQLGHAEAHRLLELNPNLPVMVGLNGQMVGAGIWSYLPQHLAVGINNLGTYFGSFFIDPIYALRLNLFGVYSYYPIASLSANAVNTPLDFMLLGLPEVPVTPFEGIPVNPPVDPSLMDPNLPAVPSIDDLIGDHSDYGGGGESKNGRY